MVVTLPTHPAVWPPPRKTAGDEDQQSGEERDDAEQMPRQGITQAEQQVNGVASFLRTDHRQQAMPAVGKIEILESHNRHQKIPGQKRAPLRL